MMSFLISGDTSASVNLSGKEAFVKEQFCSLVMDGRRMSI